MKKVVQFLTLLLLLVLIIGCNDVDNSVNAVDDQAGYTYSISVVKNGIPVSSAKVMGIVDENEEVLSQCDKNGFVTLKSQKPLTAIFAGTLGATGFINTEKDGLIKIHLSDVDIFKEESLKKRSSETFWYVHYVNSDGDAYYRYSLNRSFSHFWLWGNIPSWVCEPDPNNWGNWYLTDYLPNFHGWKILIPRRAQWYYPAVYGRVITADLYLVTNP